MDALRATLALLLGYLLGSVLPCRLFAQRRGVDIACVGDGNPGTVNAFSGLGPVYGLATALYDGGIGLACVLAARALGTSEAIAYLAGLLTIVGHRFPLYTRFRGGGQGMAAAAGLVVYGAGVALANGWFSWLDLSILVAIGAVTFAFTRSGSDIAIVLLPVLVYVTLSAESGWAFALFESVAAAHIWVTQVVLALRTRRAVPAEETARENDPLR